MKSVFWGAMMTVLVSVGAAAVAQEPDDDRHAGYYYPPLTSEEVYPARSETLPDSNRTRRIGFVVAMTQEQMSRPYAPVFAMYAKGADAEKLIIVTLDRDSLVTLYQMRSFLAQMTAQARATPFFIENRVEDWYTFLDLLKLLGFTELTVSDGQTYAHQYRIE